MLLNHNITKQKSLLIGKAREDFIYNFLSENQLFNTRLHRAKYLYSEFDFYDDNGYLYEVKSLTYSVNKYSTAIINSSKLIFSKMIFIFEYTEANNEKHLYYHLYDVNRNYNQRYITPFNRLNTCSIIDIPICLLVRFYDGKNISPFENPCKPITDITEGSATLKELETFNEIIRLDKVKANKA